MIPSDASTIASKLSTPLCVSILETTIICFPCSAFPLTSSCRIRSTSSAVFTKLANTMSRPRADPQAKSQTSLAVTTGSGRETPGMFTPCQQGVSRGETCNAMRCDAMRCDAMRCNASSHPSYLFRPQRCRVPRDRRNRLVVHRPHLQLQHCIVHKNGRPRLDVLVQILKVDVHSSRASVVIHVSIEVQLKLLRTKEEQRKASSSTLGRDIARSSRLTDLSRVDAHFLVITAFDDPRPDLRAFGVLFGS